MFGLRLNNSPVFIYLFTGFTCGPGPSRRLLITNSVCQGGAGQFVVLRGAIRENLSSYFINKSLSLSNHRSSAGDTPLPLLTLKL